MKKLIKKISVLLGIFLVAVSIYFIGTIKSEKKEIKVVYTSMEEAVLPMIQTEMFGREVNFLPGYTREMDSTVARDSLTILPADRQLGISIERLNSEITGISYEVRSMDQKRLIERTQLEGLKNQDGKISTVLPIQNLIKTDVQYLLRIQIDRGESDSAYYYTRIMQTQQSYAEAMLSLAVDFSSRTFDYEQARELVAYLETNGTADNSSLGYTTIKSSFSQLTWGGIDMKPLGETRITLKELDGLMGQVQLRYLVSREDEGGETEIYEVEDNFTMKWNDKRIYLMDYNRKTNQIFTGSKSAYSGSRIMLGINHLGGMRVVKSEDKLFTTYVINKDLWLFDQKNEESALIFSFRSDKNQSQFDAHDQHGIKVLNVSNEGDVDFIVYGYMNRGEHEGNVGIAMYYYDRDVSALEEKFFAPFHSSYELLKEGIDQLSYMNSARLLYLKVGDAIYAIDLSGGESMVIADALTDSHYAVSQDEMRIAWQDGGKRDDAKTIHLMNLDNGKKLEITAPPGELVRSLGFVGNDFVYGRSFENDEWIVNGRIMEQPMYALEIVNYDMQQESRYEKEQSYVSDVRVGESRVHLKRAVKVGENQFAYMEEDTIVCNEDIGYDEWADLGWFIDPVRGKLYFVQLDLQIKFGKNVGISAPKKVIGNQFERLELKANSNIQDMRFYAYGGGHYLGNSLEFSKAVAMAHDQMGLVVDQNQTIVWNRVSRVDVKQIKEPQIVAQRVSQRLSQAQGNQDYASEMMILDARGCTMSQILYFVNKGCPVIAYNGEGSYLLISGYDNFNITYYDPNTGETGKMGLSDGASYFSALNNDFICGLFTE